MTPIEKQILLNQVEIMRCLKKEDWNYFDLRLQETSDLLNPESNKEEPCCEMPEREEVCNCGHGREYHFHHILESDGTCKFNGCNCKEFVISKQEVKKE